LRLPVNSDDVGIKRQRKSLMNGLRLPVNSDDVGICPTQNPVFAG